MKGILYVFENWKQSDERDKEIAEMMRRAKNNPYKFTGEFNHYFMRHMKDRWSWYVLSGELWASKTRKKFIYEYSRDYAYKVFERYIRRFGYLDDVKAIKHLDKICERWQWGSGAYIEIPQQSEYVPFDTDGEWCPVDYFYTSHLVYDVTDCKYCGSKMRTIRGITKGEMEYQNRFYRGTLFPAIGIDEEDLECSNSLCRETREFMEGRHSILDKAKELKVYPKRPIKKYKNATDKEKLIIASSTLLDFEARYIQKKNKLSKAS